MNLATTLLFGSMILGQAPANLDFAKKSLDRWDGSGFAWKEMAGVSGAWSDDSVTSTRKGMLRHAFTVPAKATRLIFRAVAVVADDNEADARLDVVLAGEDNAPVRRTVRTTAGWSAAPQLLKPWQQKPREYSWDVSALVGKMVQVVLIDNDDRPGSHVWAGGFQFQTTHDNLEAEFAKSMLDLQKKNNLAPFFRFDSKRFAAISNAGEAYSMERLKNCEIFADHFLDHFEKKGFKVTAPNQRLMLAVFQDHAGFDAYFGQRMPAGIAGIYHTPTNRLVLYDLKENRAIAANRENTLKQGSRIDNVVERSKFLGSMERKFAEHSSGLNLSTTMHECAHLISFNCGLLNRESDAACWVVEGMATYCEAVDRGDWTALGGSNPMRLNDLNRVRGHYIPLLELVRSDKWRNTNQVLTGYAQCWSLFHMLMKEEPAKMRAYLKLIYDRKTSDHRVTDFIQCFGDVSAMETRHFDYMRTLLKAHTPTASR